MTAKNITALFLLIFTLLMMFYLTLTSNATNENVTILTITSFAAIATGALFNLFKDHSQTIFGKLRNIFVSKKPSKDENSR